MKHYPVMLPEVLTALEVKDSETVLDGTFGNGGYSAAILKTANCHVIALDRDPNVAERGQDLSAEFSDRFRFIETPFSKLDGLGLAPVDAVVLDIGVSSMQLDQAERGFSFMREGPLDMRMQQGGGPSARDAVRHCTTDELTRIFQIYGEEKRARHAANCIVSAREGGDIVTTTDLAAILEKALGRRGKTHPATRVFQALRIFVNDELGELYKGLCAAERLLRPGGRLVVVSFHSLEDRIVKSFFRRRAGEVQGGSRYAPAVETVAVEASFTLPTRRAVKPSKSEVAENPRSRSAKLRVGVRTSVPAFSADDRVLPELLSLAELEVRL